MKKKEEVPVLKKETTFKSFKNGPELEEMLKSQPNVDLTGMIASTLDGKFIVVKQKAIRLASNFKQIGVVDLPDIGYEPHADRCILLPVNRQDQYTKEGFLKSATFQIKVGNTIETRHKLRYFIVKAGTVFSNQSTGNPDIKLEPGDEIILADHLDGIPHMPVIEDPIGYIANTCYSIHYSEIAGYVKHKKKIV